MRSSSTGRAIRCLFRRVQAADRCRSLRVWCFSVEASDGAPAQCQHGLSLGRELAPKAAEVAQVSPKLLPVVLEQRRESFIPMMQGATFDCRIEVMIGDAWVRAPLARRHPRKTPNLPEQQDRLDATVRKLYTDLNADGRWGAWPLTHEGRRWDAERTAAGETKPAAAAKRQTRSEER